jgi:hypothetical protein
MTISEPLSQVTNRMIGGFLCDINSQKLSKQHGLTDAFRQLRPSEYDRRTRHRPRTKLTHEAAGLVCPRHKHAPIFSIT